MRMMDQGHYRIAVLTKAPANEASPTVDELNAGIGLTASASCFIPKSAWKWSHGDDKAEADTSMCDLSETEAPTEASYDLQIGVYSELTADGQPDPTAPGGTLLTALQTMGTTLWIYVRRGPESSVPFKAGDIIYLGGRVQTGSLKVVDGGNQKWEAKLFPQHMYDWITVAAGTSTPAAPTLASLNPTTGPVAGGTTVTLTGTGFTAGTTVSFGGTAATSVTYVSPTQVTAVSPAHAAGAVQVTATTAGGTTAGQSYTYA